MLQLEELLSFADGIEKNERQRKIAENEIIDDAGQQPPASIGQSWRESFEGEEAAQDGDSSGFNADEVELLSRVGDALSEAMLTEVSGWDLEDELTDEEHQELMFVIFDKVIKAMKKKRNKELDDEDRAFVRARVAKAAVEKGLQQPPPATKRRFAPLDRVVCRVGGDRGWAAGTVQALDQEDDEVDPYGTVPYMVKIDPPNSFGFSVPADNNEHVRAEVCFGVKADARLWTLRCLPRSKARGSRRARRFKVGERVACAVEAHEHDYATDWAAGTVSAVDPSIDGVDGAAAGGVVAYSVAMDSGATVLVQQDEHWLVRDLALQPAGPRVAADGTRALTRMGKRRLGDGSVEECDHATRNVRIKKARDEEEDESDDDD